MGCGRHRGSPSCRAGGRSRHQAQVRLHAVAGRGDRPTDLAASVRVHGDPRARVLTRPVCGRCAQLSESPSEAGDHRPAARRRRHPHRHEGRDGGRRGGCGGRAVAPGSRGGAPRCRRSFPGDPRGFFGRFTTGELSFAEMRQARVADLLESFSPVGHRRGQRDGSRTPTHRLSGRTCASSTMSCPSWRLSARRGSRWVCSPTLRRATRGRSSRSLVWPAPLQR